MKVEKKFMPLDLKTISEEGVFEGYASKWGIVDQGGDFVSKGAFKKSVKSTGVPRIKMLWQHDPHQPIGMWSDVKEDDTGLYVKGQLLLSVSKGAEVNALMKAGIIEGLSIGYRTLKATRDEKTGTRNLLEVELWEISVVTFPMLPEATISKGDWTKRDVEHTLRDAGMPNAMAVKLISGGWDAANTSGAQRDAGSGGTDLMAMLNAATNLVKG
jgi:HK97 family phage prohead protease